MTLDDIIATLRTSDLPPDAALRAAVPHAGGIAPRVFAHGERYCRGICLEPDDEREYFCGLHILAAARHPDLWPHLLTLARAPDEELDTLFIDHAPLSLASLMLAAWDGDATSLMRLIEHADMGNNAKWALFDTLARLTFDKRIPREETIDFLTRFERDGLADDDSEVWWGWESAVVALGEAGLEEALRRVWTKPAYASLDERIRLESLAELHANAAAPADAARFDEEGIFPALDPVAALAWMHLRTELSAQDPQGAVEEGALADEPVARGEDEDIAWLARFLTSRQVPAETMPLTMLDGYLTALVVGPVPFDLDQAFARIFSEDGSRTPEWDGADQEARTRARIGRLAAAIAQRRKDRVPHRPNAAMGLPIPEVAADWAEGFAFGVDLHSEAWAPIFDDRNGAEDALAIIALCENETEYFGRPATEKERRQIVERLPVIVQRIAAFWDDPAKGYPRSQPIKVDKIGRNDPCPCGSGKKYKKCCGQ